MSSRSSFDTEIRYFTEDGDRDISRAAKVEYIMEEMAGLLELPEEKLDESKKIYRNFRDRKSYDVVAVAGALLWASSFKHPAIPRWREWIQDACLQISKDQNSLDNAYHEDYYQKRLIDNIRRVKEHVELSPTSGVEMMWEVLRYYEDEFPKSDFQRVKTFCMKYMPILEHSQRYMSDSSNSYAAKSKSGMAAALLYIGMKEHISNTSYHLSIEELCSDLGKSTHRLEDKIESIESDLNI